MRLVDEGVLAPVSDHEAQAHDGERDEEDEGGGAGVDVREHGVEEEVGCDFAAAGLEGEGGLAVGEEVPGELEPDEEVEAAEVVEEVEDVVALVADRRGKVVGPVAFDVVVLDVVEVVRVPGVAHERVHDVWEGLIDQGVGLVEDAAHVDVLVHHERVGAHVVQLHERVERAVPPLEVVEEVDCRGYARREVEEQMGEHDNVGVDAHDRTPPSHVRVYHVFSKGRVRDARVIYGYEDGGLEFVRFRVVELFHEGEGLLLDLLGVYAG